MWAEVVVLTCWAALLNCCRANGHERAHVAK